MAKRGIELSELRDDGAFRTSKSRALKKLRTSEGWIDMTVAEQEKVEKEVVHQLEEKRDAKKRAHEMEWFHKVENHEIASDEDDERMLEYKEENEVEKRKSEEETDDEWLTEDSEDGDREESWKGDSIEFMKSIIEVQRRSGHAFIAGLKKAEEIAVKKEKERCV